jgi:TolB-like protein
MNHKTLLTIIITLLCVTLSANPHFTGDGGRGMSLAVLVPDARGLDENESHLPSLIQQVLAGDLTRYSAISVLDRLRLEAVLRETESGIYRDESDFIRLGEIANVNYALTGSITKTGIGYAIQIQIISNTTGISRASFSSSFNRDEIERLTGIHRVSLELLAQMGVNLTASARNELAQADNEARMRAENALARGHAAQRRGTEVAALSYFIQASSFDPSLLEAVNRTSILHTNISSGNIGMDVRNEIAWRRQWVDRLTETEQFFHDFFQRESMPYTFFYIPEIRQGEINWNTESVNLSIKGTYFHAHDIWLNAIERTLQAVYDGLLATGNTSRWELEGWPRRGVTNLNAFTHKENNFNVVFELLNDQNRSIGRTTVELHGSWQMSSRGRPSFSKNTNYEYVVNSDGSIRWTEPRFLNVNAKHISENMTIRAVSINGVDIETALRTANLQIRTITHKDYLENARFIFSRGEIQGFVHRPQIARGQTIELFIPDNMWGDPVNSISSGAFNNIPISVASIPNSNTTIGLRAFSVTTRVNFRDRTIQRDVYMVGSTVHTTTFVDTRITHRGSTLLINEEIHVLAQGNSNARSVFVSGDDVYVAGEVRNRATLWKNGVPQTLSRKRSVVRYLYVDENDVYVAGRDGHDYTLWKNGVPQRLGRPFYSPVVRVFNGDVYVLYKSAFALYIHKNGTLVTKIDAPGVNYFNLHNDNLYVLGDDVYVFAIRWIDIGRFITYIYKNGVFQYSIDGFASSIAVNENHVYVLTSPGILWRDNERFALSDPGHQRLFVLGHDVYTAGYCLHSRRNFIWENGIYRFLPDAMNRVNSIFVIDR